MKGVLPLDFREFLSLLHSHKVEYLVIGGYAVGYHGYPRATPDMDIWIAHNSANAERMVAALRAFGFDTPELPADVILQEQNLVRLGKPPMCIKIMTKIPGVNFDECYAERTVDIIDGVEVNFISLKHLKINKKASGRYKDLNDLENLP
ncbi:MAG: DUF6036 family nucleotidyltransferase [bacterium]